MLKIELLQQLLIISMALSTITCAIIQKTKKLFKSTKYLCFYSFLLNILVSIVFCQSFTNLEFPLNLWVGLFSFLGADTIYKSLEGTLAPYKELVSTKTIHVKEENLIKVEEDN